MAKKEGDTLEEKFAHIMFSPDVPGMHWKFRPPEVPGQSPEVSADGSTGASPEPKTLARSEVLTSPEVPGQQICSQGFVRIEQNLGKNF